MNSKTFKLAIIQMSIKGGEKDWNIQHASDLISEAASKGAQVVLLPECVDLGWTDSSCKEMAGEIPSGNACQVLMKAAKENAVYVCSGLTEKCGDDVYNSAVLIDRNGIILLKHRKLNELTIGHGCYELGDRLNVAQTEFGVFGLMICADAFADRQVLSRSLCYMGADVILSPCAWAVPNDHDNEVEPYGDIWREAYKPVAEEFSVSIIGVSNVGRITDGPWKGRKCIGCSLAVDASGKEILQGPYGVDAECILLLDIQLTSRPARGTGWDELWNK